jgi:hypothetical protein
MAEERRTGADTANGRGPRSSSHAPAQGADLSGPRLVPLPPSLPSLGPDGLVVGIDVSATMGFACRFHPQMTGTVEVA